MQWLNVCACDRVVTCYNCEAISTYISNVKYLCTISRIAIPHTPNLVSAAPRPFQAVNRARHPSATHRLGKARSAES